jgi:hypothetical protein
MKLKIKKINQWMKLKIKNSIKKIQQTMSL